MSSKRQKIEAAIKKAIRNDEICPHSKACIGTYKRYCHQCIADVVVKALQKKDLGKGKNAVTTKLH